MTKEITGKELKKMRQKKKLTLRRCGILLDYEPSSLWRIENGQRGMSKRLLMALKMNGWIK